jgi:ferredoxin
MKKEGILIIAKNCRGCRSCALTCSYVKHKVFNPAKSYITLDRDIETDHTVPMISPLGCDLCGACVHACPYGALVWNTDCQDYKFVVQA